MIVYMTLTAISDVLREERNNMATVVNRGTKMADSLIYEMNRVYYKGKTLYDCYGKVSAKKRSSWEAIVAECNRLHGEKLHITGAGSHMYSCIYAYPVTDDDGVVSGYTIRKETRSNTYELTLPIDEYIDKVGLE